MTTKPYIGMPVWKFDQNTRVYKKNDKGHTIGPIWREHWVRLEVVGETSRSWLVGSEWSRKDPSRAMKVPKKDWPGRLATSEEDIDKAAYVNDNRYRISERVQRCNDYDTLKKIEAILEAK